MYDRPLWGISGIGGQDHKAIFLKGGHGRVAPMTTQRDYLFLSDIFSGFIYVLLGGAISRPVDFVTPGSTLHYTASNTTPSLPRVSLWAKCAGTFYSPTAVFLG